MRPLLFGSSPKTTLASSVRPGAHEAGKPHDLARVDVEAHVAVPVALQFGDAQHLAIGAGRAPLEDLGKIAADHQPHDLGVVQLRGRSDRDELAVAQDRDAVAEPQDLFDAVRHVDDRHALVAQTPDERKEAIHLLVGERRGRLVEGEHPDPRFEGAHDFNELPLGGGKLVAQQIWSAARSRTRTPRGCGAPAR